MLKNKKLGKRIWSLVFCLCMVLSSLPVTVFAETVGETGICTACGGLYSKGVCTDCGSVCTHGTTNDEGCTICGYAYPVSVTVKNVMMIDDEGTTTYYFTLEAAIAAAVKASAKNSSSGSVGSIYVNDQTVTVTLLDDLKLTDTINITDSGANVILVGGEHTVGASATMFNITGGILTVKSGNYITTSGNVFYVGGKVTLPASSGDVVIGDIGVSVGTKTETTTHGALNISGGSYTSAGHTVYLTRVTESSESDEQITAYTAMGTANISDGVFTSTGGYAVYNVWESSGKALAGGNLTIVGGEFNGGLYIGTFSAAADDNTIKLSGGKFSRVQSSVTGALSRYLPQYYAFFTVDESGEYTIPTAAKSIGSNAAAEIKPCTHIHTKADGVCDICGMNCAHTTWDSTTGKCSACGVAHDHDGNWEDGVCSVCDYHCKHGSWNGTTCKICGFVCTHATWNSTTGKCNTCGFAHDHTETWANGVCTVCGYQCKHGSWNGTTCKSCGFVCTDHVWKGKTGSCSVCGYLHIHESYGADGCCTVCGGYQRPSTDTSGTYLIANAEHLYWFAAEVNSGNTSINGKLTADIVVNKNLLKSLKFDTDGNVTNGGNFRMWTPIGNGSNKYTGTFDGANHTVSGLYYNGSDRYVGLFGRVNGASIKNVGVIDNYFCISGSSVYYFGGLVGEILSSDEKALIMENCYHSGTIIAKNTYGAYVGGLAGSVYSVRDGKEITIKNCYNTGSITSRNTTKSAFTGGLLGGVEYNARGGSITVENCYNSGAVSHQGAANGANVGGLIGYADCEIYDQASLTLQNSYNTGTVHSSSGGAYVGGLIGYAKVTDEGVITIQTCYNAGSVSGASNVTCIGGLVGYILAKEAHAKANILNCYNVGTVHTDESDNCLSKVGGMVGRAEADEGTIGIENGYNTGSISTSSKDAGTLIGYVSIVPSGKVSIQNVYSLDSSGNYEFGEEDSRMDYDDTVAFKSADEFASGAVAWLLNGGKSDGVWKQTLGTDAHPYFTGARVSFANESYYNSSAAMVTIGGDANYYDTLEAAFAAASGKTATITLLSNTTLTSTIEINSTSTDITLVGGVYTVGASATMFKITAGNLTVQSGTYTTSNGNVIEVGGTATKSTTSSGSGSSGSDEGIYIPSIGTGTGLAVTTKGTANISGGSFTSANGHAVYVFAVSYGDGITTEGGVSQGTVNISGGTFGGSNYAVYVDKADSSAVMSGSGGKLNVSGGSFGKLYVASFPKDDVVLSGGTFAGIELAMLPTCSLVLKSGYAFYTEDETGDYTVLTAGDAITDKAVAVKLCTHTDADGDGSCDICNTAVTTVSVTITWTSMEYTYTDGTWSFDTHSYGEGIWSTDGGTVTVENVGSATVTVSFGYVTVLDDISGSFTEQSFELSANASGTTALKLSDKPGESLNNSPIGTVTVTIAKKANN